MLKKLIALAVAAISAAPAFAQSNVTVYGRMDYGFVSTSGDSGGSVGNLSTKGFESGVAAGSRLGFKGSEDLGNGLKAIFEIESGVSLDTDSTAAGRSGLFTGNRHSYVGLSGNFGTVVGGHLDGVRYGIWNKYDPFAGGTVGNITQITAQVDRADNAVAYISPNFSGFNLVLAYATHLGPDAAFAINGRANNNEAAGNQGDAQLYTANLNYANGPISAAIDIETVKEKSNISGKHKVATVAGSYDFGVVKLSGLWDSHKSENHSVPAAAALGGAAVGTVIDYRAYMVGLSAPVMGKGLVKLAWGKRDDKNAANADTTKWGVGFDYNLSKRTYAYVDYGKISNKNGATTEVDYAANRNGLGNGVKGFDLGIAHKF